MKTESNRAANMPEIVVFQEADGWHWSPKSAPFRDARGPAYSTRTLAREAARRYYEQHSGDSAQNSPAC